MSLRPALPHASGPAPGTPTSLSYPARPGSIRLPGRPLVAKGDAPMSRGVLGSAGVWFLLAGACLAAPPQIEGTRPLGVKRGEPIEVTVQGARLAGHPRLVAPFPFSIQAAAS